MPSLCNCLLVDYHYDAALSVSVLENPDLAVCTSCLMAVQCCVLHCSCPGSLKDTLACFDVMRDVPVKHVFVLMLPFHIVRVCADKPSTVFCPLSESSIVVDLAVTALTSCSAVVLVLTVLYCNSYMLDLYTIYLHKAMLVRHAIGKISKSRAN